MVLNVNNRNYNVDMEVLCLLSPKHPVKLTEIAADLGFPILRPVRDCIERLVARGFDIRTSQGVGQSGVFATIPPKQWPAIKKVCERYWQTTYGA